MSGTLPALRTSHGEVISVPHKIITHLRKEVGGSVGRRAASERSSVISAQHTFIDKAELDAGDPELQGEPSPMGEAHTVLLARCSAGALGRPLEAQCLLPAGQGGVSGQMT